MSMSYINKLNKAAPVVDTFRQVLSVNLIQLSYMTNISWILPSEFARNMKL